MIAFIWRLGVGSIKVSKIQKQGELKFPKVFNEKLSHMIKGLMDFLYKNRALSKQYW